MTQQFQYESKNWGQVWHLFASDQSAVSFLQLVRGTRCSRHWHDERANMFAVISGKIEVQFWGNPNGEGKPGHVVLNPGNVFTVPYKVVHRFRVLESGQVVEVYWPDPEGGKVRFDDINRLDEGGMDVDPPEAQEGMKGETG